MKKEILTAAILLAVSAMADTADSIKEKLSSKLVKTHIDLVTQSSEMSGLYEVHTGPNIFYTDSKADVIMIGHIFDMNGTDLTQIKLNAKMAEFRKKEVAQHEAFLSGIGDAVKTGKVDLTKALKIGNGKHKVVIFTDPECPFCRKSEDMIKGGDMTKYVFFNPLPMHQRATPLSVHILCSKNPAAEFDKAMHGELDAAKLNTCEAGTKKLNEMVQISKRLGVMGTPLFNIDGKTIEGANPEIAKLVK